MYTPFDIEKWNRKHTYHFFKTYDDPFFNICTHVDVAKLHALCKKNSFSFHLSLLFCILKTVNETIEFRLRLLDGNVVLFDTIHCGSTVLHEDNTFTFCYFPYTASVKEFNDAGRKILNAHLQRKELQPRSHDLDLIYSSSIPWTSFTSITHARNHKTGESIPKFAFGKYFQQDGKLLLPISIEVNHALMDGYHVGTFLSDLQECINTL